VLAWDVLDGKAGVDGKVVVFDAGFNGWPFCGTLDFVSAQGHEVVAVTPSASIGVGIEIRPLYRNLFARGVQFMPMHVVDHIGDDGVALRHSWTGEISLLSDVTSVVVEAGGEAVTDLATALEARGVQVELIGDAMAPRRIVDAIREGNRLGRTLA
jgi:hypothetical protein